MLHFKNSMGESIHLSVDGDRVLISDKREYIEQDAAMQALQSQTITEYRSEGRLPYLILNATSWVISKVPYFLFTEMDIKILYYPCLGGHVVSAVGFPVGRKDLKPVWSHYADKDASIAIRNAVWGLLKYSNTVGMYRYEEYNPKVQSWYRAYFFKCSKMNLNELLHSGQSNNSFVGPMELKNIPELFGMHKGGRQEEAILE